YQVIGVFLGVPYQVTYERVGFPATGGPMQCASCHKNNDAWKVPAERTHPAATSTPTKVWSVTCGSCHDSIVATAHIATQSTPNGVEACVTCHGPTDELSVERVHLVR
ncbi:MAG TPA: hypothetical protein VIV40_39400, partial [Kofleriaceae bacterium]